MLTLLTVQDYKPLLTKTHRWSRLLILDLPVPLEFLSGFTLTRWSPCGTGELASEYFSIGFFFLFSSLVQTLTLLSCQSSRNLAWLCQVLHPYWHLVIGRHCGWDDRSQTSFPGFQFTFFSASFSHTFCLVREIQRLTSCLRSSVSLAHQLNRLVFPALIGSWSYMEFSVQTWPGVTQLPDYKPTFPQWKGLDLADAVKNVSRLNALWM